VAFENGRWNVHHDGGHMSFASRFRAVHTAIEAAKTFAADGRAAIVNVRHSDGSVCPEWSSEWE
jgi:transketolase C-terminal domain/subunit